MSEINEMPMGTYLEQPSDLYSSSEDELSSHSSHFSYYFSTSLIDYSFENFDKTAFLVKEIIDPSPLEHDNILKSRFTEHERVFQQLSSNTAKLYRSNVAAKVQLSNQTREMKLLQLFKDRVLKDQSAFLLQKELNEQAQRQNIELGAVKRERDSLMIKLTKISEEFENVKNSEQKISKNCENLQKKLNIFSTQKNEEMKDFKKKLSDLSEENRKIKKSQKTDQNLIEKLTNQLQKTNLELIDEKSQRITFERNLAKASNNENILFEQKKLIRELKKEATEKDEIIKQLEENADFSRNELEAANSRIAILEEALNQISCERDGLNLVISRLEKKLSMRLPGQKDDIIVTDLPHLSLSLENNLVPELDFAEWTTDLNFGFK